VSVCYTAEPFRVTYILDIIHLYIIFLLCMSHYCKFNPRKSYLTFWQCHCDSWLVVWTTATIQALLVKIFKKYWVVPLDNNKLTMYFWIVAKWDHCWCLYESIIVELFRIGWIWRVQQMTKNSSKFILFGLAETILVDILKVQYIYIL